MTTPACVVGHARDQRICVSAEISRGADLARGLLLKLFVGPDVTPIVPKAMDRIMASGTHKEFKMAISKQGIRAVALAMSLVGLSTSVSAFACGGDWYPEVEVDPRIHGVAEAEKALSHGNYVAAAGSVVRMIPHIKALQGSHDPLVVRAERVLAVAISRSNGSLALEQEVPSEVLGHWLGKTPVDHDKNMTWSVAALRRELAAKHDDPGTTTDLGEALSKLDGGAEEARALLESLAARDLVATPEAYRALAQLRQQRGDEAGQKLALKRCESMASAAKVCEPDHRAS
jgi:hypothetical protein